MSSSKICRYSNRLKSDRILGISRELVSYSACCGMDVCLSAKYLDHIMFPAFAELILSFSWVSVDIYHFGLEICVKVIENTMISTGRQPTTSARRLKEY